ARHVHPARRVDRRDPEGVGVDADGGGETGEGDLAVEMGEGGAHPGAEPEDGAGERDGDEGGGNPRPEQRPSQEAPQLSQAPLKMCACSFANWSKVRAGWPVTRGTISETPDAPPAAKTT